jgi:hypothetical protein
MDSGRDGGLDSEGVDGQHGKESRENSREETREETRAHEPARDRADDGGAARRIDKNKLATSADHQLLYGPRVPKRPARDLQSPLGNPEVRLLNAADLAKLDATRGEAGTVVLSATPLVEVTPDGSLLESRPYHGLAMTAEMRRRGTLVVGATGSGKTYRFAIPLIHALLRDTDETILYNNLKGPRGTEEIRELVKRVAPGTPVTVFAPGNAARSVGINLLKFTRRHRFESTFVAHLLAAIEKGRDGSNYWELIAKPVFEAVLRCDAVDSIAAMHELLSNSTLLESLAQRTGDPDLAEFTNYRSSGSNGATSGVDLAGRIAPLCATDAARAVASGADEFDLVECIASPQRSVLVIECSESTYRSEKHLVSLFLTLWFQSLLKVSEDNGGELPRGVNMIIDEFGVTPTIPDLAETLNLGRSRGYAFYGLVQSLNQVRATYKEQADSIFAGFCSSVWFCSGIAVSDREIASRIAGNIVVKDWSTTMRETSGGGPWEADSRTSRSVNRPLLLPEDFLISDHPNFGGYAVACLVDSKPAYAHFTGAWECPDIAGALAAAAQRPLQHREHPLPAVPKRGLVKFSPASPHGTHPLAHDMKAPACTLTAPQMRTRIETLRPRVRWPIPCERVDGVGQTQAWCDRWIQRNQRDPLRIVELFEAMAARGMTATDLVRALLASKADTPETAILWSDFEKAQERDRRNGRRDDPPPPAPPAVKPQRPKPDADTQKRLLRWHRLDAIDDPNIDRPTETPADDAKPDGEKRDGDKSDDTPF